MFKGGTWDKEDKFDLEINQEIKKMVEKEQISRIIVEHKEIEKLQDSIDIGSAVKGGNIKIYGDFSQKDMFKAKIDNALFLRNYAKDKLGITE